MLSDSTWLRLRSQLDALSMMVEGASPSSLEARSPSGKWSARENVAHLARYQQVFVEERLKRILHEARPSFGRYRAEEDPEWPAWQSLAFSTVLDRLRADRADLVDVVAKLSSQELGRVGFHPLIGDATIPMWLEFFLLHEAHHLYVVLRRLHGSD